jgi:hypothetical protein
MSVEKARQLIRAFAPVAVAQKAAEDPDWADVLAREPVQHRLALWIMSLGDEALSVLVRAACFACARHDGESLATVLRVWLGFDANAAREGDRLLALADLLDRPSPVERASDPLRYLRRAVTNEARRVRRDIEKGSRNWARIGTPVPYEHQDGSFDTTPIESLAVDGMDPEARFVRRDDLAGQGELRRAGRRRPALNRLLGVASALRVAGLSEVEDRLLRLLEVGIPPADAERLVGCGHSAYVNLVQKARRRAAA